MVRGTEVFAGPVYAGTRRTGDTFDFSPRSRTASSVAMRVRVNFEYGAGVCLWADDAEARERWVSAVEFGDLALPADLAKAGAELLAEFDTGFLATEHVVECRWTAAQTEAFLGRARDWAARVRDVLAGQGIELAENGVASEEPDDGPEFDGCVVACFADEAARVVVDRRESASFAWAETATWLGDTFKFRASERSPAEFLAKIESDPGFVCGWWQASEGGSETMIEGDSVEHAVACVRSRNATGLANFLSWLRVERVHLGEALRGESWEPTKAHRLADVKGSWWEWVSFLRNATKALQGGKPSTRYQRSEKERLFWRWTNGGTRAGWPANWGEAFSRIGLRQESSNRWTK